MNHAMQSALKSSDAALKLTSPNPRVGCVLTDPDGNTIGTGHTQQAGGPHAEIMALRDAAARGFSTVGATAYVTLEPCSHFGRTGPCCDALIAAGIGKVVASIADPNPLVSGQGFEILRAAGIEVEVGPGAAESRELNLGFFSRMIRRAPWVRMKIASSLDGTTALENGQSQWITSPEARTDGHAWRARASAVLTGIGTLLEDNPRLDVRLVDTPRQPHRIVVDSHLQTPVDAAIFGEGPFVSGQAEVWIYCASSNTEKRHALEARGARVIFLPDAHGKVDLGAMMQDLAHREINELHVEAGHKLNGSLVRAALVDEFLVYMAPKFLGPGRGMAFLSPIQDLHNALALKFMSVDAIGPDVRLLARIEGRDVF
jgi:diaminohydroxyphosphoribosylaminopyrimidine deaminase / 5-amino-6-(5-phosphoribosylamino)uracil reductase